MKNTLVILGIILGITSYLILSDTSNEVAYYYCDVDKRVEKKITEYTYEYVNQETVRRRLIVTDETIKYWDTSYPAYKYNHYVTYPKNGFWPTWLSFDRITLEISYEYNWESTDGWYRRFEHGTCTRIDP